MRRFSYILSFLAVALFLLLAASAAKADLADPKIVLGPTGSQNTFNQSACFASTTDNCFFTTDAAGDPVTIDIFNDLITGDTDTPAFIIQDTITIDAVIGALTCGTDAAPNWTGTPSGNSCIYTGGFISPGNTYGWTFSLFAPSTKFGFHLAALVSPTAPTVPEPGTIVLLGTGLVAVFGASRKRLKGATNHAF
jgi:hypothetical protein